MHPEFWMGLFYGALGTGFAVLAALAYSANRRVQRRIDQHPATECQRLHSAGRCLFPACYCGQGNTGAEGTLPVAQPEGCQPVVLLADVREAAISAEGKDGVSVGQDKPVPDHTPMESSGGER